MTERILSLVNQTVSDSTEIVKSRDDTKAPETKKLFRIVYGKQTKKKHKTWEGDGTLCVGSSSVTAKDEDGKVLGNKSINCKLTRFDFFF